VSREAYLAGQSRRFLDKLCGGKLSVLAAALCDSGLSRDEIEELRGLLERDEL
jgi:predicted transcriptional regulator